MRRWTTAFRFSWTPIITYTRRQLMLLDWIEENLDPVAFANGHDSIGIALVSRDIRMTISANGMSLEDGSATDLGVAALGPVLDGVIKILEPKSVVLHGASIAWSGELESVSYNEARARFAREMSGHSLDDDGLLPIDASGLMDVVSTTHAGQVEWGVVSAPELFDRLSNAQRGRIAENRPDANLVGIGPEDLPEASIFVDTSLTHLQPEYLDSREGMEAAISSVEDSSKKLATRIFTRAAQQIGKEK
jgi:hypothetical protein